MDAINEAGITADQFKNLLAFIFLMSDEFPGIMGISPAYVLEKYARYMGTERVGDLPNDQRWLTGLHPHIRVFFNRYCEKWEIA